MPGSATSCKLKLLLLAHERGSDISSDHRGEFDIGTEDGQERSRFLSDNSTENVLVGTWIDQSSAELYTATMFSSVYASARLLQ